MRSEDRSKEQDRPGERGELVGRKRGGSYRKNGDDVSKRVRLDATSNAGEAAAARKQHAPQ